MKAQQGALIFRLPRDVLRLLLTRYLDGPDACAFLQTCWYAHKLVGWRARVLLRTQFTGAHTEQWHPLYFECRACSSLAHIRVLCPWRFLPYVAAECGVCGASFNAASWKEWPGYDADDQCFECPILYCAECRKRVWDHSFARRGVIPDKFVQCPFCDAPDVPLAEIGAGRHAEYNCPKDRFKSIGYRRDAPDAIVFPSAPFSFGNLCRSIFDLQLRAPCPGCEEWILRSKWIEHIVACARRYVDP